MTIAQDMLAEVAALQAAAAEAVIRAEAITESAGVLEGLAAEVALIETPPATYALSAQSLSVDEGAAAVFVLTTTNVPAGTSVGYTITGVQPEDVFGGELSGSFVVDADGIDSATITLLADALTEGTETIHIVLDNDAAELLIDVNDTSTTPAPPPPPPSLGPIARALAEMAPGEFRSHVVSVAASQLKVTGSSGTYWILDWTPRWHYDAPRNQFVHFGCRQRQRFIAFTDVGQDGEWRDIPQPAAWADRTDWSGHWYGWSAQDDAGGVYLRTTYRLDLATETYAPVPAIPAKIDGQDILLNGSNGSMCAMLSGNRMARYGSDRQFFVVFDADTQTWGPATKYVGNGQHALHEYHPLHDKSLIVGGNSTTLVAHLVTPDGVKQRVADLPEAVSMSSGSWIVAHPSGCWLVKTWPATGPKRVFAYWPAIDTWQDLGTAPDAALTYSTAAYRADADAVVILHTTGIAVWRCPALTQPGA